MTPPFLAQLDPVALAWSAGVALCVGIMKVTARQRHELREDGEVRTHWVVAVIHALVGSVLGGVVGALFLPERYPQLRTPGGVAVCSVGSAIIAPYLLVWVPRIIIAVVEWFAKHKFGVEVKLRDPDGGQDEKE